GLDYLLKLDSYGSIQWSKTYSGLTGSSFQLEVQQTSDGGYIIGGLTNIFGSGGNDVMVIKTNSFGDTLWTKTYGGIDDEQCYSIQQTSDGGYIICGTKSNTQFSIMDIYVIKTDSG